MAVENLSDMPLELKPLAPFLQRSQELKVKDPTMSYWCLYYAVQQGVHLKPRDKQSRDYLLKLMTPLETIRAERNNNVLTDEKQACPYIEDFALRVFDSADNEDRRGDATRGTAKKFLAAANFLELLKVFEENPNAPSTSADANSQSAFSQHKDKIRYAKWKAGDIAKAFREGRKPTPGPANGPDVIRRELEVAAIEPSFGPGPGPNAVDQARQFSRDSSSASSPVPGGSRNASVSPRRRNVMLPLTSVANGELGPRPMVSPPASATASAFGFPPSATNSLIRDAPPTAPATATTKPSAPPFGRSHSATTSMDTTRPGLPPPPRDLMNVTTPVKAVVGPNGIHLGPGKPGVSPGTWSTAATPGGFEESVRKSGVGPTFIDQGSPSRVPEGAKRPVDDSVLPSRQYPPTPALALKAMQHGDDEEKRLPPVPRQESFASNATTAGGALSRTASYKSQDSAPAKPTEEPEARPKRVRWTPSVVGGTSTVASNSPPHSPMSPLGTLPTLPESDSSSNEGVRFSGPPTEEKDANGRRAPKNPYAEYPTPAARATQLPPVKPSPPHSPRIGVTQPPSLPGSATSSLISANGAKRSPMPPPKNLPVDQAGTPRGSIINTPSQPPQTGSGLSVNPSAPSFPAVSAPVSPATSNVPKAVNNNAPQVPTRLRRASESATGSPMNGIQPLIKPFVPRFPAHPGHTNSADTSPAGSTLINTISTLGRPKSLTPTPTSSPPPGQKTSPPLPRKAISPPPPASLSAIRDLPNSVNGRSSPNNMTGRSSPLGRMPTPPVSYQPAAPARELPKSLPFRQISAAKKHSKFAASALEFDDLETARQELLAALAILNGEKVE